MDGRELAWIEPLVSEFSRPAFQLAAALVKDPGVAEEIVQEAFVRALTNKRTPRVAPEFRRWFYRIVLNLAREHYRRQARRRRLPLLRPHIVDAEEEAHRRLGDNEMERALQQLSPRQREAVYLRYFEDAAYEDIAAIMGISTSTTRVLVHRALDELRARLPNDHQSKRESR